MADGTVPNSKNDSERTTPEVVYRTKRGRMICGKSEDAMDAAFVRKNAGKVNLIFTSPPFPLKTQKKYGNMTGERYLKWLTAFVPTFKDLLAADGSLVIEIGNAWEPGRPVMSTLPLRALLAIADAGQFHVCQQFICHNPARLPGPAQWVNVDRIRVKDTYTHVWWFSTEERPKANNRNVLTEYSPAMRRLLRTKKYNAGARPSEAVIGEQTFLTDNRGAIPPNVVTAATDPAEAFLVMSNTRSNEQYLDHCRKKDLRVHPARMPRELPEFFIRLLTDEGDLVLDPFAGSNTTGSVAETLNRRWISIEAMPEYAEASRGRFGDAIVEG